MGGMVRTVAPGDGRCPSEKQYLHLRFLESPTIDGAGIPAQAAVTGQLLSLVVAAESSGKPPLTRRPAPDDPSPPPTTQR